MTKLQFRRVCEVAALRSARPEDSAARIMKMADVLESLGEKSKKEIDQRVAA